MHISDSVEQILHAKATVIRRFYDRFLDECPEAKRHFVGVRMEHQASMLTMALVTIEAHYSHSYPATDHYLKVLGCRHRNYGIPKELFAQFGDSLIATLRDFHQGDWDQQLEQQWTDAFEKATTTMFLGYEEEFIY